MKIYELRIDDNLDYETRDRKVKLIVANGVTEAEIRAKSWTREIYGNTGYSEAKEITEIDGFKVTVSR